jgi:hypothetical protein
MTATALPEPSMTAEWKRESASMKAGTSWAAIARNCSSSSASSAGARSDGRAVGDDAGRGGRLDGLAHLEDVARLVRGHGAHDGAAPVLEAQQPLGGQAQERLVHGGA